MENDLTARIVIASEGGHLDLVEQALAEGASPDAMGPNSGALHVAAFGGHAEVVRLLLAKGANPNLQDKQSFFPLQLAVSKGHAGIAQSLIEGGAELERKTKFGGTALHVAAASNQDDALKVLIQAGAELHSKDQGGNTPLHAALSLGNIEIAQLLLDAGAKASAQNDAWETPWLTLARALKKMQVRKGGFSGEWNGNKASFVFQNGMLLLGAGDSTRTLTHAEALQVQSTALDLVRHHRYLLCIQFMADQLQHLHDLTLQDQDGNDLLMLASHVGEPRLMESLPGKGLTATRSNKLGVTALHFAAGSGRLDGLETLTRQFPGLDYNVLDQFGWTPLHYLADIGGHADMAHLLLAMGAEKQVRSTQVRGNIPAGSTPKDVALHWKDQAMADLL